MPKIRLTKNELKTQKDDLKRFTRYLPTLELKKKQLLVEIMRIQKEIEALKRQGEQLEKDVSAWVAVFGEEIDLSPYVQIKEIVTEEGNIAGIDIPVFEDLTFEEAEIDVFATPFWVDRGVEVVRRQKNLSAQSIILEKQEAIVREELRTTIQRIKLFEEVKIPEAREAIRVIQIFLGDQMTAEVVRGKIAKTKIQRKKEAGVV